MPRAGLGPATVTSAGAVLADETGLDRLSMALLAARLGVKVPSLYKHVDNLADLTHRIGVLAMVELADATGEAVQGRAGREALDAAAQAMRRFVGEHPGRYAAGNLARRVGPEDPLVPAARRLLDALSAALRGYGLGPEEEVHALRTLRSMVHGFASLEERGGFALATSSDDSFAWMLALVDHGLRSAGQVDRSPTGGPAASRPPTDTRPDTHTRTDTEKT